MDLPDVLFVNHGKGTDSCTAMKRKMSLLMHYLTTIRRFSSPRHLIPSSPSSSSPQPGITRSNLDIHHLDDIVRRFCVAGLSELSHKTCQVVTILPLAEILLYPHYLQ